MAKTGPPGYLSLPIGGAKQSKYDIHHFSSNTKEHRGYGLQAHLIGVLQHAPIQILRLFNMTGNNKTAAKDII